MGSRPPELLTAGQVADLFGVDPKTVARWADQGRLPCRRTLGGHRRFPRAAVRQAAEAAHPGRPDGRVGAGPHQGGQGSCCHQSGPGTHDGGGGADG